MQDMANSVAVTVSETGVGMIAQDQPADEFPAVVET
jgi:hypothetical protein